MAGYVVNIEDETLKIENFRKVLNTAKNSHQSPRAFPNQGGDSWFNFSDTTQQPNDMREHARTSMTW